MQITVLAEREICCSADICVFAIIQLKLSLKYYLSIVALFSMRGYHV